MENPGLSKKTRNVFRNILRNFLSSRDWMGKKYWLAKTPGNRNPEEQRHGERPGKALHAAIEPEGNRDHEDVCDDDEREEEAGREAFLHEPEELAKPGLLVVGDLGAHPAHRARVDREERDAHDEHGERQDRQRG